MTPQQQIDAVLEDMDARQHGISPEAPEGFWAQLLRSLRITVQPGKSLARPVECVRVEGGAEF